MLLDATLLLGDTMTTTTAGASTSSIDCQAASNDYKGALFVAQTETTAATYLTTAATNEPWCYFELQTSSSSTFANDVTTLVSSATINPASMKASKILCQLPIPSGAKRYLQGYFQIKDYVAATRFFTTISYSMYIVYDADNLITGAQ